VSIKFFATALLSSTLFYLKVNFISPWMRSEKGVKIDLDTAL